MVNCIASNTANVLRIIFLVSLFFFSIIRLIVNIHYENRNLPQASRTHALSLLQKAIFNMFFSKNTVFTVHTVLCVFQEENHF